MPKNLASGSIVARTGALALILVSGLPAVAQQPPAASAAGQPTDPRLLAAQKAFEALPEAERKAIQQDLGFATSFSGAALGTFGSLTFNGIQAFERQNNLTVDGILTPQERQALAAMANGSRRAQKFAVLDDARSGVRIGIPQAAFTKREPNTVGGSRWQTADGKATLDTTQLMPGGETLQQLFDKAIVSTSPARKVTYKLIRPDFFVVAGETPTGKFYRRMALGQDGAIRGFTLGYDKALATDMDKTVITVANSFDPFPSASTASQPTRPAASASGAASTSIPVSPPVPRDRLASGIVLDGGFVLTAAAAIKDCKAFLVGARKVPGRVAAADTTSGLALVRADGLSRSGPAFGLGSLAGEGAALTAVGQAWSGAAASGIFSEALVSGSNRITAPLQPGGAGAGLFDITGALAGVVTDDPGARKQIAGVVPATRYRFANGDEIGAFLQKNSVALPKAEVAAPLSSVAAVRRGTVVAVLCTF